MVFDRSAKKEQRDHVPENVEDSNVGSIRRVGETVCQKCPELPQRIRLNCQSVAQEICSTFLTDRVSKQIQKENRDVDHDQDRDYRFLVK